MRHADLEDNPYYHARTLRLGGLLSDSYHSGEATGPIWADSVDVHRRGVPMGYWLGIGDVLEGPGGESLSGCRDGIDHSRSHPHVAVETFFESRADSTALS